MHQQIVAKMREKASDQAAFAKLLRLLHNAARQKQPLPSLKNHVLDAGMLKDCLQQVRMSCGFPIPPDPEESEAASSLFQQEMVNVVENRGDPDVVPFTMLFVRLGADVLSLVKARLFRGLVFVKLGLLSLITRVSHVPAAYRTVFEAAACHRQVQPTAKHHADGYEYLWCVRDIWAQLQISSAYFAWWGKNARDGLFDTFQSRWDLSARHIIRPDSYRGEQPATIWPGLKYDSCSTAGLLLMLGMFAQIRGLSSDSQKRCLGILRRLLPLTDFSAGLRLLPDCFLEVEDGRVNLSGFFSRFEDDVREDLERRPLF